MHKTQKVGPCQDYLFRKKTFSYKKKSNKNDDIRFISTNNSQIYDCILIHYEEGKYVGLSITKLYHQKNKGWRCEQYQVTVCPLGKDVVLL